jgi:drug/metabolite transporter (DMT)-like permease
MSHPSSSRKPSSWALIVGFAGVYLPWGTTYLPTRIAIHDDGMPPLLFGGVRIFCGGLLLLCYLFLRGAKVSLGAGDVGRLVGVSLVLFVAGSGLMFAANETINSGVCAVLAATTPLWLGLFAMFWPGCERLTARGWLGLLVGLGGVLLLLTPKITSSEEFVKNIGVVLVLGSAASWANGSLILRHMRLRGPHLTTAAYQLLFGGAGLVLAGALIGEGERWPAQISMRVILAFLYLLLFGSLVGFVAYNWLLGHVSAAKVGTYAYVNPVLAVLVGWAAGEEMTATLAAGIGVILFGVFLVRGGERPATRDVAVPTEPAISETDWKVAQISEPS